MAYEDPIQPYRGALSFGRRGDVGGENSSWGIDPTTGREVPVIRGPNNQMFLSTDLVKKFGSWENISAQTQPSDDGGWDVPMFRTDIWGARPSNDTFSGKDGLQDLITIAAMAAVPFTAGASTGAAGTAGAAAGTAAFEGGVTAGGVGAAGGAAAAGTGLTEIGSGMSVDAYGNVVGSGAASGLTEIGGGMAVDQYGNVVASGAGGTATSGSILSSGTAATAGTAASTAGSILSNPQVLGAGLGAAASLLGGGDKPAGTTTTVQDIPEWLKSYAAQGLGGMVDAYNTTPNGVAPVTQAGNQYMLDVIGGDYLNSNPYLDAMFNKAAGKVGAQVNSQFSSAGRYGSGAHTGVLGESIGNLATDIYGRNYATERQNQQQAAAASPAFGSSIISQPFLKGQNLLQGVNSIKGGTTSQPYFQNQAGDALGGALGGMALGKMFSNYFQ